MIPPVENLSLLGYSLLLCLQQVKHPVPGVKPRQSYPLGQLRESNLCCHTTWFIHMPSLQNRPYTCCSCNMHTTYGGVILLMHLANERRHFIVASSLICSWAECHFLFSLVYQLWFCSMINSLIVGCLWPLVFVLNNFLVLGIWCSAISHRLGCFCPWTFFQDIGFNMVPSDPFMSHLATQLGYSAGEFQALELIVLAAFGVVD